MERGNGVQGDRKWEDDVRCGSGSWDLAGREMRLDRSKLTSELSQPSACPRKNDIEGME